MKKLLLSAFIVACGHNANSQNVILWENFQGDSNNTNTILTGGVAPGELLDTTFYIIDGDGGSDGSGNSLPTAWFLTTGFAYADTALQNGDTNFVLGSSSWLSDENLRTANYLILPSIHINDSTVKLQWKSAPFQTPKYLDGYTVVVSTNTNEHTDQFLDTIFKAGEFISVPDIISDSSFSSYVLSDTGFIHGEDGTYIEYQGDSARFAGVLRPFELSLGQYVDKDIYIAFLHNSLWDNLLSIDDIKVIGNGYISAQVGINELDAAAGLSIFPNPANDHVTVDFALHTSTQTSYQIIDVAGKVVASSPAGFRIKGSHSLNIDTQNLANGNYLLNLNTGGNGKLSQRFSVAH